MIEQAGADPAPGRLADPGQADERLSEHEPGRKRCDPERVAARTEAELVLEQARAGSRSPGRSPAWRPRTRTPAPAASVARARTGAPLPRPLSCLGATTCRNGARIRPNKAIAATNVPRSTTSAGTTPTAETISAEPSAPSAIAPSLAIPSPAFAEASCSAGRRLGRSDGTHALETRPRARLTPQARRTRASGPPRPRRRAPSRPPGHGRARSRRAAAAWAAGRPRTRRFRRPAPEARAAPGAKARPGRSSRSPRRSSLRARSA